ncbi:GDP-mannose 4,6-dehydratase [Maritalea sp.]|uniref:GDP-mannose 4,6-dehydratase n=1 Tax=Maritalea sp. TaxID=2003361 RepID=UPI003EF9805C
MHKTALITGVTGQDGSLLAQFLLEKGYRVHGILRRTSSPNTARLDMLLEKSAKCGVFTLHHGDMTDASSLIRIVQKTQPDEIYNFAAQSDVGVSFDIPEHTANIVGLGTLRLLEAIKILGLEQKTRFFQASSSEMYGDVKETPQNELTPFRPRSPYATAKLHAYWTVVNYREAYGLHASNGVAFNHESPIRGEEFVTRKITRAVAAIQFGKQRKIDLGNLDAQRDWGHAQEYVQAMWAMLQQDEPSDYVLATGVTTSVRQFTELAFKEVGIQLAWRGKGLNECGYDRQTGECLVEIDPRYFRPTEIDLLIGDAKKAREKLGWSPKISVRQLIREMVQRDLHALANDIPNYQTAAE